VNVEKEVPAFAWDVTHWDQSRWDVPGLEVDHGGRRLLIDHCLCAALDALGQASPVEFSDVDLESYGQKVPGWPSAP
jgi:hypothetical protein